MDEQRIDRIAAADCPGHCGRHTPRHAAHGRPAALAWRERSSHRAVAATLIDISLGGASALVEDDPPEGEPVWLRIRLDDGRPTGWIGAIVVEVAQVSPFSRRRRVRLRFCEGCPSHDLNADFR